MILNAVFNSELHYAETLEEMLLLVAEIIEKVSSEDTTEVDGSRYYSPGATAELGFSEYRHAGGVDFPDNYLKVSVNKDTGYGALVWCVDSTSPLKGGIFDFSWVTDNRHPPSIDPRVVGDADSGVFHDSRNVLPINEIVQALREYCLAGTGLRPESVRWAKGDLSGRRFADSP